jgi:hypothetical protein
LKYRVKNFLSYFRATNITLFIPTSNNFVTPKIISIFFLYFIVYAPLRLFVRGSFGERANRGRNRDEFRKGERKRWPVVACTLLLDFRKTRGV